MVSTEPSVAPPGAGPTAELAQQALARLIEAGSHGLAATELERALGDARGRPLGRIELEAALSRLRSHGEATVWARRWRAIELMPWVVGRVRKSGRHLELIPRGEGPKIELPASRAKGAMPGDLVLVRVERSAKHRGRRTSVLPRGTVLEVLRAGTRQFVGCLVADRGRIDLIPYDSSATPRFGALELGEAGPGEWVVVEARAAGKGATEPAAVVIERLGRADDPSIDSLIACRRHRIRESYPGRAMAEAAAIAGGPRPRAGEGRKDRRRELTVTIDGADAKDFDDAISITRTKKGFAVVVHIADVAHYVAEGKAIDAEAVERGTSVYFPDRVVPMLPPVLADDLCSLVPNQPRLTVSARLEIDRRGTLVSSSFEESLIESRRRLTYEQADLLLAGEDRDPELAEMFSTAGELLTVLRDARRQRGSLDIDLPSVRVRVDVESKLVALDLHDRLDAHRLIEELMILANRAVAGALVDADRPALHRVHDPPDADDLEGLAKALEALGVPEAALDADADAGAVQRLLAKVPEGPLEPVAALRALRAMKRAVYTPESRGHWALGLDRYLHFTSPIRRYPDLVAHRRLKDLIHGRPSPSGDLEALGLALSTAERAAEAAERDVSNWKRIRALVGREGETFMVTVTDLQPFGAFVRLDDAWVDGLLPAFMLGEGPFRVTRAGTELRALGSGKRLRLGERLEAVLARVDVIRRQVDLEPRFGSEAGNQGGAQRVEGKGRPRRSGGSQEKNDGSSKNSSGGARSGGARKPRVRRSR